MSGPLQRRTVQNSYPLLVTWGLQHTCMSSVNRHSYTDRGTQLSCTHTHFSLSHLICQVFICPKVVKELQAIACVFVAGTYLMGVIGRFYWLVREWDHDRLRELVINREMAPICLQTCIFLVLYSQWLQSSWRVKIRPVDTLVRQRSFRCECMRVGGLHSAAVEGHDRNRWAPTKNDIGTSDKHSKQHKFTIYWNRHRLN